MSSDTDTDHPTPDFDEQITTHSLAGGGELEVAIRGRENAVRTLETAIRAAVNRWGSRYFQALDRSDYQNPPLVTRERKHPAIQEAVDEANARPSWAKNHDGEMAYEVAEAYYPDDYDHFVDLRGIDAADRAQAFMHAQAELAQRGFVINSARSNDAGQLTKLHIVRLRWIDAKRGREGGDDWC